MKRLLLIFLLVFTMLSSINTSAQEMEGLVISLDDFTLSEDSDLGSDDRKIFQVIANGTVHNPTQSPISFTHSDLCRFKLEITIYHDNASEYFPIACAEATETVEFEPGNTTFSALSGIALSENVTKLPNTNYTLFVDIQEFQKSSVEYNYGISFGVVDGEIADIYYDILDFHNTNLTLQTSLANSGSLSLSLWAVMNIAIVALIRLSKKYHD